MKDVLEITVRLCPVTKTVSSRSGRPIRTPSKTATLQAPGVEGLVAFGSPLRIAYGVSTGGYRLTKAGNMALDISNREQGIHSDPEKAIEAAFSTSLGWLPGLERCPISQF